MPFIRLGDHRCYYRLEGADDKPVLILSHSLGLDHGMWDAQASDLLPHFRVLRYDTRGHGASDAPPGDYSIEMLARETLALADGLGIETFALCGLSMGGMIGQWLAVHAPERLTRLVLANTTARVGDPHAMEVRRRTVLESGMASIETLAMSRYFSEAHLEANDATVAYARRTLLGTDPVGYAGCCAALRDLEHRALLAQIKIPTLVISGDADVSMPWLEHGRALAETIPGAAVVRLAAGHISNLEKPRSFTDAVMQFLLPVEQGDRHAGLAVRRAVLGEDHVNRALANMTPMTTDFQELITRFAWGTIWTRPGLDHRTRRLLVLAMMASLGRWEEFRLHLKAGLSHGLEPCDIREVLLQTAVYAGVPAANTAFKIMEEGS